MGYNWWKWVSKWGNKPFGKASSCVSAENTNIWPFRYQTVPSPFSVSHKIRSTVNFKNIVEPAKFKSYLVGSSLSSIVQSLQPGKEKKLIENISSYAKTNQKSRTFSRALGRCSEVARNSKCVIPKPVTIWFVCQRGPAVSCPAFLFHKMLIKCYTNKFPQMLIKYI